MGLGAAIGSVVGGLAQAGAARSAARAQERAGDRQLELSRETRDLSRADLAPYREAGLPAQNLLNYYLGLSAERPMTGAFRPQVEIIQSAPAQQASRAGTDGRDRDERAPWPSSGLHQIVNRLFEGTNIGANGANGMGGPRFQVDGRMFNTREEAEAYADSVARPGTPMPGFQETPGYQFARREGLDAVEAGAAARGGLFSGATMQSLQQRGNDLANLEFGNYLNRLEGQITRGQNAAAQSATVNMNTGQMGANALGNIGNARAAGAIGVGNAISDTINNGIGIWQYQNTLNRFPAAPAGGGANIGGMRPVMSPFG